MMSETPKRYHLASEVNELRMALSSLVGVVEFVMRSEYTRKEMRDVLRESEHVLVAYKLLGMEPPK